MFFVYVLQTLTNDMNTDDEIEYVEEKESYICAVCLDVYFNPYMCYPCHHIFCEPCLRTLARDNPASTPCPLCRTIISRVFFQTGNFPFVNMIASVFSLFQLLRYFINYYEKVIKNHTQCNIICYSPSILWNSACPAHRTLLEL